LSFLHEQTQRKGFTLAELVVVLVLMVIIFSIALPRVTDIGKSERLKTTARRLAGMAKEAYSEAAVRSQPWFLVLDLEHQRGYLSESPPEDESEEGRVGRYYRPEKGIKIQDVNHPTQGQVTMGKAIFVFWPQGMSQPGTVHLISDSGDKMTVFLRPHLGKTEIKDGYLKEVTAN
jgi:prepilin-type N-terminal cleavage/methylation domain-containing protein